MAIRFLVAAASPGSHTVTLAVCNVWEPDCTATKKRVAKLEAKVCAGLKWVLDAVTPTSFCLLYLARALSEAALAESQSQVRELMTE